MTTNKPNERISALAAHLKVDPSEITTSQYDEKTFVHGNAEYLVVTDDEADELWDEYLDNYINDVVLSELPEQYRFYFDSDKFKNDASMDGRANALASYDGGEDCEKVNGLDYYIYRTN